MIRRLDIFIEFVLTKEAYAGDIDVTTSFCNSGKFASPMIVGRLGEGKLHFKPSLGVHFIASIKQYGDK